MNDAAAEVLGRSGLLEVVPPAELALELAS
jgi:hypothetical protein